MNRKECLDAAAAAVLKDRQATYGTPEDNFGNIMEMWTAYKGVAFTRYDVAAMMALVKLARVRANPHHEDNWADLAGYAACGAELATTAKPEVVACPQCRGIPERESDNDPCDLCHEQRVVRKEDADKWRAVKPVHRCSTCDGRGTFGGEKCEQCNGSGVIVDSPTVVVDCYRCHGRGCNFCESTGKLRVLIKKPCPMCGGLKKAAGVEGACPRCCGKGTIAEPIPTEPVGVGSDGLDSTPTLKAPYHNIDSTSCPYGDDPRLDCTCAPIDIDEAFAVYGIHAGYAKPCICRMCRYMRESVPCPWPLPDWCKDRVTTRYQSEVWWRRVVVCPVCGKDPDVKCVHCRGTKVMIRRIALNKWPGAALEEVGTTGCPECCGDKRVGGSTCAKCGGSGRILKK